MTVNQLHRWNITPQEAIEIQKKLASLIILENTTTDPVYVGGADISIKKFSNSATASITILSYPGLELVDWSMVNGQITFPYIPGLLSFREVPLLLNAWECLSIKPDILLVDGQGIAHPRRMGLACHLGLLLDRPTIGCAKSRLIGECRTIPDTAGSWTELYGDNSEIIGAVLCTKNNLRPLYVSPGYKINLMSAINIILSCCRGHRIPEPLRLAHLLAGGNLKPASKNSF